MPPLIDHAAGPDLRRRALSGGVFAFAAQGVRLVLQIGTTAVLARMLVPADYGLVAMVLPFVALIQLFQDAGLGNVTLHRRDLTAEQVSALFWVNIGAGMALSLVLAGLAPLIAVFYDQPRLTAVAVAFAAVLIPATAAVQHRALLQRAFNNRALAAIDVTIQVLGAAVAVAMAWLGAGYWALVGQAATLAIAQLPLLWLVLPWNPGRPRGLRAIRPLIRAGGEITGFNLMSFLARNVDNVAIGRAWGEAALGLYGRAYNLMLTPISQINGPIGVIAVPVLSRLAAEPARYRAAVRRILENLLLATQPGTVLLVVASDAVVRILFGPGWAAAAPILSALAVAALVQPANNATGWLFVSQGRSRDLLRWGFVGAPLQIAAILAGLPWGAMGVAVAYAATEILAVTPLLWRRVGSEVFSARDAAATLAPYLGASVLSGGTILLARSWLPPLDPLALLIAGGVWTYAVQALVLLALPSHRRVVLDLAGIGREAVGSLRRRPA
jgi:polysaccharide transporter, PST family